MPSNLAGSSAAELAPTARWLSIDRVRNPWAMVPPNGVCAARSGSTWMNWWSWVTWANWSTWSCVTSNQSPTPSSFPMSSANSAAPLAAASLRSLSLRVPRVGGRSSRRCPLPTDSDANSRAATAAGSSLIRWRHRWGGWTSPPGRSTDALSSSATDTGRALMSPAPPNPHPPVGRQPITFVEPTRSTTPIAPQARRESTVPLRRGRHRRPPASRSSRTGCSQVVEHAGHLCRRQLVGITGRLGLCPAVRTCQVARSCRLEQHEERTLADVIAELADLGHLHTPECRPRLRVERPGGDGHHALGRRTGRRTGRRSVSITACSTGRPPAHKSVHPPCRRAALGRRAICHTCPAPRGSPCRSRCGTPLTPDRETHGNQGLWTSIPSVRAGGTDTQPRTQRMATGGGRCESWLATEGWTDLPEWGK